MNVSVESYGHAMILNLKGELNEDCIRALDEVINQTVTRILDQFGIDVKLFHRWDDQGMSRHPDAGKTTTLASAKARQRIKKQL